MQQLKEEMERKAGNKEPSIDTDTDMRLRRRRRLPSRSRSRSRLRGLVRSVLLPSGRSLIRIRKKRTKHLPQRRKNKKLGQKKRSRWKDQS
jgi:hypothetical protein